jgi:AraC-like DNA-binding protein
MNQMNEKTAQSQIILGPPFHRHWSGAAGYSIKAYVGGRVPFIVERRLHVVDDAHYLIVNAGQDYEFRTPADSTLFNFTIFMSEAEVADAWASLRRSDESLLDDPDTADEAVPEFLAAPMRVSESMLRARSQLRTLAFEGLLSIECRAAAVSEIIGEALATQYAAVSQMRKVHAVRRSTQKEAVLRVRRAVDFIEADITRELDLSTLSKIACMAKHHFLRRFKDVIGQTPHQFILRRRLALAEELLLDTDLGAAEIGRLCGFADASAFSSAFRASRGLAPLIWRGAQKDDRKQPPGNVQL